MLNQSFRGPASLNVPPPPPPAYPLGRQVESPTHSPIALHLSTNHLSGGQARAIASASSPLSPYPYSPSNQVSPSMARVEYNPQQWGPRGPTGGAYVPHTALSRGPTDPEAGGEKSSSCIVKLFLI
jgi:hypothetical protein